MPPSGNAGFLEGGINKANILLYPRSQSASRITLKEGVGRLKEARPTDRRGLTR